LAAGFFGGTDSARAVSTSFLANENLSRPDEALRFFTASSAAARCWRRRSAKASSFAPDAAWGRSGAGAGLSELAAGLAGSGFERTGALAAAPGRGAIGAGFATTLASPRAAGFSGAFAGADGASALEELSSVIPRRSRQLPRLPGLLFDS